MQYHGLQVDDRYATKKRATKSCSDVRRTVVTADTMTMEKTVTSRDLMYLRQCTVKKTVTTNDTNVTHRPTHDGYSRHGLDERLRLVFTINYEYTIRR